MQVTVPYGLAFHSPFSSSLLPSVYIDDMVIFKTTLSLRSSYKYINMPFLPSHNAQQKIEKVSKKSDQTHRLHFCQHTKRMIWKEKTTSSVEPVVKTLSNMNWEVKEAVTHKLNSTSLTYQTPSYEKKRQKSWLERISTAKIDVPVEGALLRVVQ